MLRETFRSKKNEVGEQIWILHNHEFHNLYTLPDIVSVSLRVKRPGREADHSPPTGAEVKNTWLYISTPPYVRRA
jgi:hypothetical protein